MLYRSILLNPDTREINDDDWKLLSAEQKVAFACWSIQQKVSVYELIDKMGAIVEQINDQSQSVWVMGYLPNCGLYGCISPDGSTHT